MTTGYTDSAVSNGTRYWYTVGANNAIGETQSAEANAMPVAPTTVPGVPSLSATAGNASVDLSWSIPSDGGSPLTSFKVYRGTSSGGEAPTAIATLSSTTAMYHDP